jgi:hypothetical protein
VTYEELDKELAEALHMEELATERVRDAWAAIDAFRAACNHKWQTVPASAQAFSFGYEMCGICKDRRPLRGSKERL